MKETVTVDEVIELLNSAVEADPDAMTALIEARVSCNEKLAEHPTIQVSKHRGTEDDPYRIGLLGLINGFFGIDERKWGAIAAEVTQTTADGPDGQIVRFTRTPPGVENPAYDKEGK